MFCACLERLLQALAVGFASEFIGAGCFIALLQTELRLFLTLALVHGFLRDPSALFREARIGWPPTTTKIGFVWSVARNRASPA